MDNENGQLWAQVRAINVDSGTVYMDTEVFPTGVYSKTDIYYSALNDYRYGRPVGKVYVKTVDGVKEIGWIFQKRVCRPNSRDTFLCEVWVTVHIGPPVPVVMQRYAY